ncbi:MAG: P-type conjugative transfer protein TrbJ [Alphaproteobacteria bacterium 64-6]|nr:MAG: P-type conjugative transfer protein TrbJ [Alphaproteobacteria bacterium 64-6]
MFAARIREWLKTLRKKNVAVLFATQSLADIERSVIAPALIESCPTRIFLPNDRALEPQMRAVYERFGLNGRQIEILGLATPKRDYYVQSAQGNRLFELGLGPVALAFTAASSPDDQKLIDRTIAEATDAGFADAFLRAKGLAWAADLLASFPGAKRQRTTPPPLPRIVRTAPPPTSDTSQSDLPEAVRAPEPAAAPTIRDDLLEHLAQFPLTAKPNRAARRRAARGVATALALALLTSTAIPPRAHALTVFDPANYQQNLLSAARALEQINTQLRALQNHAQMILRMDQNLTRLGGTLSPDLQRTLTAIQTQLRSGNGIALKLQQTQGTYERLFPAQVSAALSSNDVLRNAKTRWDEEHAGLKRAALLQGQIADGIETDTRLLGDAMTRSRNAAGALDATQAGNELTGLAVKQSLALQGLLAAQHRAETVSRARNLATEDEARQRFKSFVGTGSAYSAGR